MKKLPIVRIPSRPNIRKIQSKPLDQEDIGLKLHKEFNGLDQFDEDIPRANNVIDVSEPTDEQIKDIQGKVEKNQFGTIELRAGSPRKYLDIDLVIELVTEASLIRVVDLEFEHFKLKT